MGVWGLCAPAGVCPGRIFGAEASPRVAHAERPCAGVCSLTRRNLAARHADRARLVDQSGKEGWQKLDGPQPGQVRPGLIWQDAVGARPSSRERTSPLSFLECRIADGPYSCQSRWTQNGGKTDKAFRIATPMRKASWTKRFAAGWGERRRANGDSASDEAS